MDIWCELSVINDVFKNPDKLPLNKLFLEFTKVERVKGAQNVKEFNKLQEIDLEKFYQSKKEKLSALDKTWLFEKLVFPQYQPFFSQFSKEDNYTYVEKNKVLLECFDRLLQYNYHIFWCNVVHEPSLRHSVSKFLGNPVGCYEYQYLDETSLDLYHQIYDRVYKIFERVLTFKESETEYMSEDVIVNLLLANKWLKLPIVIFLCTLYHKVNPIFIDQLLNIYFSEQQRAKSTKELKKMLENMLLIFRITKGQICGFEDESDIPIAVIKETPKSFDAFWIYDIVTNLLDDVININTFLSVYRPALEMAIELEFPHQVTNFYENFYPGIREMLNKAAQTQDYLNLKKRIDDRLAISRSEIINLFHNFVSYSVDKILLSHGDNDSQEKYVDLYLRLISSALADDAFILDYHLTHQIDVQLQTLGDVCPNLDKTRIDYISESVNMLEQFKKTSDVIEHVSIEQAMTNELLKQTSETNRKNTVVQFDSIPGTSSQSQIYDEATNVNNPSEAEIDKQIQNVLEMLPDLADGFVLKCLESMNYDPAHVISAILDDNLPTILNEMPRDLIRIPPDVQPEPEKPLLAYIGKKPQYADARDLLDDKEEDVKNLVIKAVYDYDNDNYEYEDLEDFDEYAVKVIEPGDDNKTYKQAGGRLGEYEVVSDPSESSDEELGNNEQSKPRGIAFCEDPAVIRARREAKWKSNPRNNARDCVGKPKGQGQEKSVKQNRDKKNTNKSAVGNHNRKGGAQWKRNRGMLPS